MDKTIEAALADVGNFASQSLRQSSRYDWRFLRSQKSSLQECKLCCSQISLSLSQVGIVRARISSRILFGSSWPLPVLGSIVGAFFSFRNFESGVQSNSGWVHRSKLRK